MARPLFGGPLIGSARASGGPPLNTTICTRSGSQIILTVKIWMPTGRDMSSRRATGGHSDEHIAQAAFDAAAAASCPSIGYHHHQRSGTRRPC